MTDIALITGASSGLGAEYARQLAAAGYNLVLVARDLVALERLAAELSVDNFVHCEILKADLLKETDLEMVVARLQDPTQPVELLVNNAGFGLPLEFDRNNVDDEVAHLRLHNEVPLRLMHSALQGMLERGHGTIINVASVAAFIPRSSYSAVKQWLVTFSRWANVYYKDRGVKVSVVCPGFTHTNFHERMGLPPGQEGIPKWMWLEAPRVVSDSIRDAANGKGVSVPSAKYKVIVFLTKFLPSRITARAGERGR